MVKLGKYHLHFFHLLGLLFLGQVYLSCSEGNSTVSIPDYPELACKDPVIEEQFSELPGAQPESGCGPVLIYLGQISCTDASLSISARYQACGESEYIRIAYKDKTYQVVQTAIDNVGTGGISIIGIQGSHLAYSKTESPSLMHFLMDDRSEVIYKFNWKTGTVSK